VSYTRKPLPAYPGTGIKGLYDPRLKNARQAAKGRKPLPSRRKKGILGEKAGYDKLKIR
jgi:hypothetical protein